MLEGLAAVPWADLEHGYGSAADVPDLILALRSPESEVRARVRHQLYGNIFHQGTRYQASAYAVPFLLELLADPATPDRCELLGLLISLAIGYDESWLPDGFPVADYRQRAAGGERLLREAPTPTGDEDDDSGYVYWESLDHAQQERLYAYIELAAYDAVRAGVPLYCKLLGDDDPSMRRAAAYALGWFGEDGHGSRPALTAAVGDPEAAVVAVALVALGLTGAANADASATGIDGIADADDPGDALTFRTIEAALDDSRQVVRWGAAVAMARLRGPAADAPVAAELLAWSAGNSARHPDIPYLCGDLAGYAGLALQQLGEAQDSAAFDALLARIPAVSGMAAVTAVGEALRRAFPGGRITQGTPFDALNQRQQRLLQALARSPTTWGLGEFAQFGNFLLMVGEYNLPHDVDTMRAYVSSETTSIAPRP